jgi:hypothetical protein
MLVPARQRREAANARSVLMVTLLYEISVRMLTRLSPENFG